MGGEMSESNRAASRLQGLSPEQRAALEALLRRGGPTKHSPIPRLGRTEGVPLSSGQRRLWFLDQWHPGNPAYNLPAVVPLRQPVDMDALQRALDTVVQRHGSLRTQFRIAGEPVQDVLPAGRVEFRRVCTPFAQAPGARNLISSQIHEEIRRPFDLQRGPLFRAVLFTHDGDRALLVLTVHHIVADGWSMGLLYEEFGSVYHAFQQGHPIALGELPIQYTDFAAWQRERLDGEALQTHVEYWRRQLADAPTLDLPTTYPRSPSPTHRGSLHCFVIPAELRDALKLLGQSEQATLYMALLTGLIVLLHRYTRQEDIVVGSPVAGRNRPETEPLIGFFVNTLAIRLDARGKPSFREVLLRVRKTLLEALDHQEVPFERLVHELHLERDLSRNPLFQVTFQLFTGPSREVAAEAVPAESISIDKGTAIFDIAFNLWESTRGIEGRIEYSTDLFDEGYATRMAQHFLTLLASAVAKPDRCIESLEWLTPAEKNQILVSWNRTHVTRSDARCVHQLFAAQAHTHPERPAITCGKRMVTYGDLDRAANRIAHALRKLGVGLETPVAVCLPRSPELIAALLGVMNAGGVYVPIDAGYPLQRICALLSDCQAFVLIAQEPVSHEVSLHVAHILPVTGWEERSPGDSSLEIQPQVDSLAYILYTSGSTGTPKGVEIEHGALRNLVDWHCRAYQVVPADRATQLASISFDASLWEILPYLAAGACVCMVDDDTRLDPTRLLAWMAEERITISFLPTPLAETIVRMPLPSDLRMRFLLTGGDRLRHAPSGPLPFELVNHYGPTENTVVTTAGTVSPGTGAAPPIGRPISNNSLYILDENLQALAVGVPGEIYIGGSGLARGYRNRPAITAERFIPNPFDPNRKMRLYKTGDLARFGADGSVEFLGRSDRQAKVRGFRIEPGEIETALRACRGVTDALVVVREDRVRGNELCAYYVADSSIGPDELRERVSYRLPDYMVPASFQQVQSMPLTANFKVDERELSRRMPERVRRADTAPRNSVEKVLVGLWAEVLDIESVGVHDNFFTDCGGHSLLSVSLVSRVRDALQINVSVRSIFEAPTVRQLADRLLADPADGPRVETVAGLLLRFLDTLDEEANTTAARGEDSRL